METASQVEVTTLLGQIRGGDEAARSRLIDLVYDELRRAAGGMMRNERGDHTLQTTALVNEALARLLDGKLPAQDRGYFFGAAGLAMRRVLVDHARARRADKRGGGRPRVPLDDALQTIEERAVDVLALEDALTELAKLNERQSQVVTLRFFGGLTMEQIAGALAASLSTVESDWRIARAWLRGRLRDANA